MGDPSSFDLTHQNRFFVLLWAFLPFIFNDLSPCLLGPPMSLDLDSSLHRKAEANFRSSWVLCDPAEEMVDWPQD